MRERDRGGRRREGGREERGYVSGREMDEVGGREREEGRREGGREGRVCTCTMGGKDKCIQKAKQNSETCTYTLLFLLTRV